MIHCHRIDGLTASQIYGIFEGYSLEVIQVLGGCSCNVVFDDSTIFAWAFHDLKVEGRFGLEWSRIKSDNLKPILLCIRHATTSDSRTTGRSGSDMVGKETGLRGLTSRRTNSSRTTRTSPRPNTRITWAPRRVRLRSRGSRQDIRVRASRLQPSSEDPPHSGKTKGTCGIYHHPSPRRLR